MLTMLIFGAIIILTIIAGKKSLTRVYDDIGRYGYVYFFFSIVLMIFIHDTYFYWTHRAMHWKPLFKVVHKTHHLSVNPTPFAAYAFHPLEALVEVGIIPLIAFTIPHHTSAITVAVLPEAEDVDVKIEAKDLRIDTFCSSGPGGQSVNTTYSAVRITHIPTNTVVSCQDEKSQIKNRDKAMRVLRSRLYEVEMQKQQDALAKERKYIVSSGDPSEKIRTYNFPQNRLTDHRIGFTLHQLDQVMDGKLQPIIDALVTHYQAEKLKQEMTSVV